MIDERYFIENSADVMFEISVLVKRRAELGKVSWDVVETDNAKVPERTEIDAEGFKRINFLGHLTLAAHEK
jgi:hypothetical protein